MFKPKQITFRESKTVTRFKRAGNTQRVPQSNDIARKALQMLEYRLPEG
jgi:hypothetical protein